MRWAYCTIWRTPRPDGASYSRCSRRLVSCASVSTAKLHGAMSYRLARSSRRAAIVLPSNAYGRCARRSFVISVGRWCSIATIFSSASGCRDLLFNVMEHRFTIQEIASFLKEHGLVFHGFELDGAAIEKFQ